MLINKVEQYSKELGLVGKITPNSIKTAYRREMMIWHPDLHFLKETAQLANIRAVKINEAYEFLSEICEKDEFIDLDKSNFKNYNNYRTQHKYQNRTYKSGFPDPTVFEIFLKSSNIVSTGYNSEKKILYLKFNDGSIYRYFDVTKIIFEELLSAESHGKYANRNIYRFRYERCN